MKLQPLPSQVRHLTPNEGSDREGYDVHMHIMDWVGLSSTRDRQKGVARCNRQRWEWMDKLKYFKAPNQEDLDEHFAWTPGWARCDTFPQVAIRYVRNQEIQHRRDETFTVVRFKKLITNSKFPKPEPFKRFIPTIVLMNVVIRLITISRSAFFLSFLCSFSFAWLNILPNE